MSSATVNAATVNAAGGNTPDATSAVPSASPPRTLWQRFRRTGWRHVLAIAVCLFVLFPVAWILSAAVNKSNSLASARLIPSSITFENFADLFNNPNAPVGRWMANSFGVATVSGLGNILIAALAAYAFSRMRFRGRRSILTSLLVMQIFPQFLGFVAFFLLGRQVSEVWPFLGLNTFTFLILVYTGGAAGFNAFLLKGFLDSIPQSLDEAARIDGASNWVIFTRIIVPLARPMLAIIFIISFITIFSEFILASFLMTGTNKYTLPVGLQIFLQEGYNAKWGLLAAAAVVGAAPIVTVFLVAQRQIIAGLTAGSVKG